jgi:hypothetical protein
MSLCDRRVAPERAVAAAVVHRSAVRSPASLTCVIGFVARALRRLPCPSLQHHIRRERATMHWTDMRTRTKTRRKMTTTTRGTHVVAKKVCVLVRVETFWHARGRPAHGTGPCPHLQLGVRALLRHSLRCHPRTQRREGRRHRGEVNSCPPYHCSPVMKHPNRWRRNETRSGHRARRVPMCYRLVRSHAHSHAHFRSRSHRGSYRRSFASASLAGTSPPRLFRTLLSALAA